MNWLEALILGIIQGLTEFLPVSSSGHLELGKAILGIEAKESLSFSIVVHGATVLSTIIVFRNDILELMKGLVKFKWNDETKYIAFILVSMLPVFIVGAFFKENVEGFFDGNTQFVGIMLLLTAVLLMFSHFAKKREHSLSFGKAFIIGLAQALAVLPGISRSGATIATGLIIGVKKENVAKFSFLMVLIPIIGANLLDLVSGDVTNNASIGIEAMFIGFAGAFLSGLFACKVMIDIVKKGKLMYFAIYCFIIGILGIVFS